jgi:hypothetical protein
MLNALPVVVQTRSESVLRVFWLYDHQYFDLSAGRWPQCNLAADNCSDSGFKRKSGHHSHGGYLV